MATIITRSGKGAPLTNTEVDANFTNLNTSKYESGSDAVFNSVAVSGTVDGRDVSVDGAKLDGIEAGADVTDAANVTAAGALMDSELTNIAAVKALNQGVATTDDPTFTGVDLAAIATSKAVTAVDVFVYDTSKDSDGGAWRKRCQHTSWYNETLNTATRGARREFPAVAVIVAVASDGIKIYDGDDPSLPLWMEFEPGSVASWGVMNLMSHGTFSSVAMLNGRLSVGMTSSDGCVNVADFINDTGYKHHSSTSYGGPYKGNIAERNSGKGYAGPQTGVNPANIVNGAVNDVAMTVLPDAPIDPATGLPVPTIAVATAGGVSVIKDDGNVVSKTLGFPQVGQVSFSQDLWLYFNAGAFAYAGAMWRAYVGDRPTALSGVSIGVTTGYGGSGIELGGNTGRQIAAVHLGDSNLSFFAGASGLASGWEKNRLNVFYDNKTSVFKSMLASVTSTYNTGWMNGDIKGAFLSSTDTASLVGSGELVTNGTFDTDTGWTKGSGWTIAAGVATHAPGIGSDIEQSGGVVAGKLYVLTLNVTAVRVASSLYVMAGSSNTYQEIETLVTVGTKTATFVAPANGKLAIRLGSISDADIDNVSVKLADADRSAANKGLIVNGTVTRSPVATGAELVAYSGFSASNYLEQPYNSALDFGTGDFCVMGWVKGATSMSTANIVSRCSGGTNGFQLHKNTTSATPYAVFRIGTTTLNGTTNITDQWNHVVAVRKSGVAYIYKNGVLESSTAATADVSGAYVTQVGWSTTNPFIVTLAGIALIRISATAPTAEQIAKIYEDEKVLFQENAAATLYGTSDAVTALAHDSDTGLLHVGTSAGRSVFQGLRRVSNTTTAVGTAISAANGMIVEQ